MFCLKYFSKFPTHCANNTSLLRTDVTEPGQRNTDSKNVLQKLLRSKMCIDHEGRRPLSFKDMLDFQLTKIPGHCSRI